MARKRQRVDLVRRYPRQRRAQETVDAIYEATARILQEEGRTALNTNRIAERAGVGISTIYQYFAHKEAILVEMARAELAQHQAAVRKIIKNSAECGEAEPDRAAIRALIAVYGKRRHMRRIAFETLIAQGLSHELANPVQEITATLAKSTSHDLLGGVEPPSPMRLFVLTRAISGVLGAASRENPTCLDAQVLEDEVIRLMRAYLRP
jgi:AcrR family transcriptional regulator